MVLSRQHYGRSKPSSGNAEDAVGITGHRHGHRSRSLLGTFGMEIEVPRDNPLRKKVWIVSLPTSAQFRAICPGSSRRKRFDIARLDEAAVDAEAAVLLTDETKLRAVEMIPTCSLSDPTELDWLILHCTIAIIGAEERCYRSLRHDAPSSIREMVPDLRFIDCSTLRSLDLPPLKVIASRIAERNWTRRVPSQQTIAMRSASLVCVFPSRVRGWISSPHCCRFSTWMKAAAFFNVKSEKSIRAEEWSFR